MSAHVFVDEVKEGGFLFAAATVLPGDLKAARRTISSLVKPEQKYLHFHKERDARRSKILDAIFTLNPEIVIYDGSHKPRRHQRDACLECLIDDLADTRAQMLTLATDDSVVDADKKLLYQRVRKAGCAETLRYRHLRPHEEPLLTIPDAIGWCWNRGGQWKQRVAPLVSVRAA